MRILYIPCSPPFAQLWKFGCCCIGQLLHLSQWELKHVWANTYSFLQTIGLLSVNSIAKALVRPSEKHAKDVDTVTLQVTFSVI